MEKKIKIGNLFHRISSDDNYLASMGDEFEPNMVQILRNLVDPDDIVADIGANIGMTAILFSELARMTYAFEPSPSTFRFLSHNLSINKIKNVQAFNLGFGDEEKDLTLTWASNNRSGGFVSDKFRPVNGHVTENIKILTLDNFFNSIEFEPTFLKIDVEGFEKNVVQGGKAFLERTRPIVVMEMNHFCLDVLQRLTIPEFLDYMRSIFPHLYAIDNDNKAIVDLHIPDKAYMVMHEHVVRRRFPNIVGGFDLKLQVMLEGLQRQAKGVVAFGDFRSLIMGSKFGLEAISFKSPPLVKPDGTVSVRKLSGEVKTGGFIDVDISLTNESNETWYGYGQYPLYLSYHWKKINGEFLVYDGIRTELQDLEVLPGSTIEQKIRVLVPDVSGYLVLIVTALQEDLFWLEDKGFKPAILEVNISR